MMVMVQLAPEANHVPYAGYGALDQMALQTDLTLCVLLHDSAQFELTRPAAPP